MCQQCLDIKAGLHVTDLTLGAGDWIDYFGITLSGKSTR